MDLNMPKINGFEVLQKIRSDERTRNIPVVVLTSSKEDADVKRCYEMGVNSYIVKPVEYHEFLQAVMDIGQYWLKLNQLS
jgi:two-component system response regulator